MTNKITIEDGQIVVSELRPMSEAPRNGTEVLVNRKGEWFLMFWDKPTACWVDAVLKFRDRHLSGWVPLPTYKPEE